MSVSLVKTALATTTVTLYGYSPARRAKALELAKASHAFLGEHLDTITAVKYDGTARSVWTVKAY